MAKNLYIKYIIILLCPEIKPSRLNITDYVLDVRISIKIGRCTMAGN